jgi:hypothetical protein
MCVIINISKERWKGGRAVARLVDFENNFYEEFTEYPDEDAFACLTIDGYPLNEEESGEIVARVWITRSGDIIVDWHDNGYRMNETVLNLINESKQILKEQYKEWKING